MKMKTKFVLWNALIIGITVVFVLMIDKDRTPGQETDIKSRPVPESGTISTPGMYFLTDDIFSGRVRAITISADNVELDLRGFKIECNPPDRSSATTEGMFINGNHGVRVYGGKITGCYKGINIADSRDVHISNMDLSYNTYIGVNNLGSDVTVINSVFSNIGGYTKEAYAIAINQNGNGCVLSNNIFSEIYRQDVNPDMPGEGVAIILGHSSSNCRVESNIFRNSRVVTRTIAIWSGGSKNSKFYNNLIVNFENGINGETFAIVKNNIVWADSQLPLMTGIRLSHDDSDVSGNIVGNIPRPFGLNKNNRFYKKYDETNTILEIGK